MSGGDLHDHLDDSYFSVNEYNTRLKKHLLKK
jgi:hypothetical protein